VLPHGASTKNAGFACFGSISEIIDDLKSHSERKFSTSYKTVGRPTVIKEALGDEAIDFKPGRL
jgi:hypothetical protein